MKRFRKGSIGIVIDDLTYSLFERGIEFRTGDGYHVYGVHEGGVISEALIKEGVVWGRLDKYYDGKSVSMILEPREDQFSDDEMEKVCARWSQDIGKAYDFGNIFLEQLFKTGKYRNERKRICSEHVAVGYNDISYRFLEKDYCDVSPNDILRDALYRQDSRFNRHIIYGKKA